MKKHASQAGRYLWFRPGSRIIWFRMAVPKKVQELLGKKIILESLGTTDRREASVLAGRKRAALFEEWGLLTPTTAERGSMDPDALAVKVGYDDLLVKLE